MKFVEGTDFLERPTGRPVIFSVWHNRLGIVPALLHGYGRRHPNHRFAILISASRDGGFLSAILGYFASVTVRGSTSRRGPQALLELSRWLRAGYLVGITPDGPRGPRYRIHHGILSLAQLSGAEIIPVSAHIHWKFRLRSWDQFQVPLPFSRIEVGFGPPLRVPRDLPKTERPHLIAELESRMRQLTRD